MINPFAIQLHISQYFGAIIPFAVSARFSISPFAITSRHVTSRHVTLCYVTLLYAMLPYVTLHCQKPSIEMFKYCKKDMVENPLDGAARALCIAVHTIQCPFQAFLGWYRWKDMVSCIENYTTWAKLFPTSEKNRSHAQRRILILSNRLNHQNTPEHGCPAPQLYLLRHALA